VFQSDADNEFNSLGFVNHLAQNGKQHVSCPHTPEHNGVAERKHRHIVETVMTLLFNAKVPLFLWVEAFMTVAFLINRMPTSTLNMKSPFSKLHGHSPNYNSLKVFGCRCFS